MRRHVGQNAVAYVALFVALGGGSYAAAALSRDFSLSGCPDLNRGPLVPQTSALTRLRHTPS